MCSRTLRPRDHADCDGALRNVWVLWENYLNDLTKKTLEKKSSNGQTWARRLAGADVMTKYHAYSIVEAMRLERGVIGRMESELFIPKGRQEGE